MKLWCPEGGIHEVKVASQPVDGERYCPEHGVRMLDHDPSSPVERKSTLTSTRKRESIKERSLRQRFRRVVCRHRCYFAEGAREGHGCTFPLDPHHLISKQWLKREYSALDDDELLELIYNPIIGVCLCRGAHHAVEFSPNEYIYRHEIDPELLLFCEAFDHSHPELPSLLTQLYSENPVHPERKT